MVATQSWLEAYSSTRLAVVVVFEGYPLVAATLPGDISDGTTEISALWNGYDSDGHSHADATWVSGLQLLGTLEQSIKPFDPAIESDTLEFRITDTSTDLLASTILREGNTTSAQTYLTSSMAAGSTSTVNVKNTAATGTTAAFTANAYAYCGWECFLHTGKTASTLTGITRGQFTTFKTNGGTNFGPAHLIADNVVAGATTAPYVGEHPRTWYGRPVTVYLHHWDATANAWAPPSSARKLWVGKIQSYKDNGDGSVSFSCRSITEWLKQPVLSQQWKARLAGGAKFFAPEQTIAIGNSKATAYGLTATLSGLGSSFTDHAQIAELIQTQLDTWRTGGSLHTGDKWSIALVTDPSDGLLKYQITFTTSTALASNDIVNFGLHPSVWFWLGFAEKDGDLPPGSGWSTSGFNVAVLPLSQVGATAGTSYTAVAKWAPVLYYWQGRWGGQQAVLKEENTWVNQPTASIPPEVSLAEGFVQIGEDVYAVSYDALASVNALTVYGLLDKATRSFLPLPPSGPATPVRASGSSADPPIVKQVWWERNSAGTLLAQLMLSTGNSAYNHATYDVYTAVGMGLGIPCSLVDVTSVLNCDDVQLELYLEKPTPFHEILEQVLAVSNRYVVWKSSGAATDPKITIVRPTLEDAVQTLWTLTESNKAGAGPGQPDRCSVERAVDGIVNRVEVEAGHTLNGQATEKLVVENVASQSDFGRRRTVTIKCPRVIDALGVVEQVIKPAIAYFSRPLATIERSIDYSLARMAPGDAVALTDNYLSDPWTGTRPKPGLDGAVTPTTVYAWVLSTRFDWKEGRGSCQLLFLPEKDVTRTVKWAPSARVDDTASNAGYDAGTKTLTTYAHYYSHSSESNDSAQFVAGDTGHVYSLDESPPTEWDDTVASVGTNTITLTMGLAGWSTSKKYVIEYRDIATALGNNAQANRAFIADDADDSTGAVSGTTVPYLWGDDTSADALTAATPDYTLGVNKPNTTYDDKSEPASVHKGMLAVQAFNALLGYNSSQCPIGEYLVLTTTSTTGLLAYLFWFPLYGHVGLFGCRKLKFRVRFKQTGGGTTTVRVRSCPYMPTGSSFTSYSFPGSVYNTATVSTTSATDTWSNETELTPYPVGIGNGMWGTWISVELISSSGGVTAEISQICMGEKELS